MKPKNFFLLCLACFTYITWMKTNRKLQVLNELLSAYQYARTAQSKNTGFGIANWRDKMYIRSKKLKYILVWPSKTFTPFNEIAAGQDAFLRHQCPIIDCFATSNKSFFEDIRRFDSIAFMGRELYAVYLPAKRALHQKYIYFNMESSHNYPVEEENFDGFFDWTMTYRLDSDIPVPYMYITDKKGNVVGPKINMEWLPKVPVDYKSIPMSILNKKTKAVAIFYSNCRSLSLREEVVAEIQQALKHHSLEIDVFGACGPYECPRQNKIFCNDMLKRKYYFYLSFENSFDIDYVSEKLLTAVQNYVVPVVYGGANYSRFLPPGSYLDASYMTAPKLADTIDYLITSPEKYLQYFWWNKYYTYHSTNLKDIVCSICAVMNNKTMLKRKQVYKKFRSWWNINNSYYSGIRR